jgi:nucleoside-diphosphate-sugar epimerase
MNVFISGGSGYVGHVLVPRLLNLGHYVRVFDTLWYGCHLPNDPKLQVIQGDIRKIPDEVLANQDVVIHLACISNDASFELDEALSRTINFDAFEPLVVAAKAAGVKRFIYCSTSSVYGVSNAPEVTEEHALVPLTLYNRYKAECEPILWRHMSDDFTCVVLRPATLCGYSPRMRFDLAVNALTLGALSKGVIHVNGGSQMRPNLHINDMAEVYVRMLTWPHEAVHGQVFNVSQINKSILELAYLVKDIIKNETGSQCYIEVQESSDDQRSYQVSSRKIFERLGYRPTWAIAQAIRDIVHAYQNHLFSNDPFYIDKYHNVRWMRRLAVK